MSYLCLLVSVLSFFSCREHAQMTSGGGDPAPGKDTLTHQYLHEWYCFNGRTIVQGDTGYGLIDTTGKEILPPVYDEVQFLHDDMLLLHRLGVWMLADGKGLLFAEARNREQLIQDSDVAYERMLAGKRAYWETIIDRYDSLSRSCLMVRSGRVSPSDLVRLESQRQDLEDLLEGAAGGPAVDQVEALRKIAARYHSLAK